MPDVLNFERNGDIIVLTVRVAKEENISGNFPKVPKNSQHFLEASKKSRKVSKFLESLQTYLQYKYEQIPINMRVFLCMYTVSETFIMK